MTKIIILFLYSTDTRKIVTDVKQKHYLFYFV